MYKESLFAGSNELGPTVLPLFQRETDAFFEKTASAFVVPEVLQYIATVRPENDVCYTLVNALGSGEFYSSNANADFFDESGLIHVPDRWTGNPIIDAGVGKEWTYGFPTFYAAHVFPHHRNQDPAKNIGSVTFAAWNARMHRVELVCRTEKERCFRQGVQSIWDRLKSLEYADVSMGARVPGDFCSICGDWKELRRAMATFNPRLHRHEGIAVAEYHKKHPIRGWAKTRAQYCEHMKKMPNKILPDGRKVYVHNHYPRFFDISWVFVGADRTAKALIHIASPGVYSVPRSLQLFSERGFGEMKVAADKAAEKKQGEIVKQDIPSQFAPAAVRTVTRTERDLPHDLLEEMSRHPLQDALASSSSLGIVLRPREYQRIILIQIGQPELADQLDGCCRTFERQPASAVEEAPGIIVPELVRALLHHLDARSALHSPLMTRIVVRGGETPERKKTALASSYLFEPLRKMGAGYSQYRNSVMHHLASASDVLNQCGGPQKLASAPLTDLFTPLTVEYLRSAFWEETESPLS